MKNRIVISSLLLLIVSCFHRKEPKITIINNSGNLYDSIIVFTSVNKPTLFYNVKNKGIVKGKILFDESNKSDGCYKILLYQKDSLKFNNCFGYYTNGASLNYKFDIKIEKDSLIVDGH